jgi:hypothetical protein
LAEAVADERHRDDAASTVDAFGDTSNDISMPFAEAMVTDPRPEDHEVLLELVRRQQATMAGTSCDGPAAEPLKATAKIDDNDEPQPDELAEALLGRLLAVPLPDPPALHQSGSALLPTASTATSLPPIDDGKASSAAPTIRAVPTDDAASAVTAFEPPPPPNPTVAQTASEVQSLAGLLLPSGATTALQKTPSSSLGEGIEARQPIPQAEADDVRLEDSKMNPLTEASFEHGNGVCSSHNDLQPPI